MENTEQNDRQAEQMARALIVRHCLPLALVLSFTARSLPFTVLPLLQVHGLHGDIDGDMLRLQCDGGVGSGCGTPTTWTILEQDGPNHLAL